MSSRGSSKYPPTTFAFACRHSLDGSDFRRLQKFDTFCFGFSVAVVRRACENLHRQMVGLDCISAPVSQQCFLSAYEHRRYCTPCLLAASPAHHPAGDVGPLEVEAPPEAGKRHDLAGYTANYDRHKEKPSDAALDPWLSIMRLSSRKRQETPKAQELNIKRSFRRQNKKWCRQPSKRKHCQQAENNPNVQKKKAIVFISPGT